jgi:acyl-CoA thioesterase II
LGLADEPFTYKVQVIRNGRGYCVRSVIVRQQDDPTICFTCICSFKKTEPGLINVQEKHDLQKKYASLLKGKNAEDLPIRSDIQDARFAALNNQEPCVVTFPGIYTTLFPFEELYKTLAPIDRKSLFIYTTITDKNSEQEHDPNLDACAHLYHSDRESIYSMIRQYELSDILGAASTLSHTVTLHVGADQLRFRDESGKRKWFWSETGAKRVADGRGLHEGRIYDSDGVLIASAMQDGMLKLREMSPEEVKKKSDWAIGGVGRGSKL